jgi:hypothetical protein
MGKWIIAVAAENSSGKNRPERTSETKRVTVRPFHTLVLEQTAPGILRRVTVQLNSDIPISAL